MAFSWKGSWYWRPAAFLTTRRPRTRVAQPLSSLDLLPTVAHALCVPSRHPVETSFFTQPLIESLNVSTHSTQPAGCGCGSRRLGSLAPVFARHARFPTFSHPARWSHFPEGGRSA